MTLEAKSIRVLDDYMKLNLKQQEDSSSMLNVEIRNRTIFHLKTELDSVILFCNDTIGRVAVNRLCRKHNILNCDGGLPK